MKKNIGILTMYHGSINYGGVLQAYALQKVLENHGYNAKQICFINDNKKLKNNIIMHYKDLGAFNFIKWVLNKTGQSLSLKFLKIFINSKNKKLFSERQQKFKKFRDEIDHTNQIYNSSNISETNSIFDVFCCGSDQIWKPGVVCPEYMLDFVDKNKYKFSYAASISKTNIKQEEINKIIPFLKSFNKISLREKYDINYFKNSNLKNIEWTLDPTLLLSKKEWENLYIKDLIKEPYIFVYLLGSSKKQYNYIKKYADKYNLKMVTIPFANGRLNIKDTKFGDIQITNAGPKEFISLIHDAKLIITDSFHATVFSNIFKTNFIVLNRSDSINMNSRIYSLLDIFNKQDRFVTEKELLQLPINCKFDVSSKYSEMNNKSIKFLFDDDFIK